MLRDAPDDANALILQGRLLTSMARYTEAETSFSQAIAACEPDAVYTVHRELGELYEASGQFEQAIVEHRKVIALRPEHAAGYVAVGALLFKMGRLDEALAQQARAAECTEGAVEEAHYQLGLLHRARERFEDAKASFERALALLPSHVEARRALLDVVTALRGEAGS